MVNIAGLGRSRLGEEISPLLHQPDAALEHIGSTVGFQYLGPDNMGEAQFINEFRVIGSLGCPISKTRSETVDRLIRAQSVQKPQHVIDRQLLALSVCEYEFAVTLKTFQNLDRAIS